MAYADQKMSGGKITALVIVALIHALLGYALVTGLALSVVKKAAEKLNTFDVEEPPPPPPPEEPPPPPPEQPDLQPPPVVTPPPQINVPRVNAPVISSVTTPPPAAPVVPIALPPAPAPAPAPAPVPRVSQRAAAKGDPNRYFSSDNYPAAALRAEAEGRVAARLTIGTNGKVSSCSVTSSSGNSDLDNATCRGAQRISYSAARDDNGTPIESTVNIAVRWQLPRD